MTLTTARIEELREYLSVPDIELAPGVSPAIAKMLFRELLAAADENARLRALLSSRASCFEHAGNCCADWCDKCRAGRQWEADVDAAVGSPTAKAGE